MTDLARSARLSIFVFVTVTIGIVAPVAALDPTHPLGIDPERAYQFGAESIDRIDLFSGSLGVTIPIGPFQLINNSNVWHYDVDGKIRARPDWENTGGIGWHLGWGEVYHKDYSLNETGKWLYVDNNGSRHSFWDKLHRDDVDDGDKDGRIYYTRDGSYLRLRVSENNCVVYIESPDGTTRSFTDGINGNCGPGTARRLHKIWSPFASEADPDLTFAYEVDSTNPSGSEDTLRTVINRYGLTHKIHLSDIMNGDPGDEIHNVRRIVTKVDLDSAGGQRSIYTFTYRQIHVDRSCKANAGQDPRLEVPHLERVDLPEGGSYSMVEDGALLYENNCRPIDGFMVDDLPGVLTGINLATGGKIRWGYQRYEFPPGDTSSVFNTGAGVKTRTLLKRDLTSERGKQDEVVGLWTYKTIGFGDPIYEMHTEVVHHPGGVVAPTGDCTKHYFDAIYTVPGGGSPRGFERGLPFVYSEESDGKYLSTQVHTGNDGNGSCDAATKIRSTYVRFRHDTTPPNGAYPQIEFINTNRQLEATRTVFHDDPAPGGAERYVESESLDFDGLGNFRRVIEENNFQGVQTRETRVGYDRSNGIYPGTYTALQTSEPWILGVFDSMEATDGGALGVQTVGSEFTYENATGFVTCIRVLASGTGQSANDLLTTRTRDALGNLVDQKQYGGDLQVLATGDPDCGNLPPEPVYWVNHEYDPDSGARIKTWPNHPDGTRGAFPIYDVDVETRTGAIINRRDTAGFQESTTYDSAGRPISVTPQSGAVLTRTFSPPTAATQATIATTLNSAGGGGLLTEWAMVLDDFGRPRLERKQLPGGVWSERETVYDARGWTESISEWGDLAKKTSYSNFDPFGRATLITPPDGSAHEVTLEYTGARIVSQTSKVALDGGEAEVIKLSFYDGFGRLRSVVENSGPDGAAEVTDYSYDVAGRLTRVDAGVQVRSFNYDARGFLLAETHPEKGVIGNGTVTYGEYDAGGYAHHSVDGPNDLGTTYDFMGRPLDIRDRGQGERLVSSFRWDSGSAFSKGKLQYADRFNYVDLPWNGSGEELVKIRQTFTYEGIGGAASDKTTRVFWSAGDARFKQQWAYDELGSLEALTYPYCNLPTSCRKAGPGSSQELTFSHDRGLLTGVPGWISQIDYHPSGLWKEIAHTNGVSENLELDDSFSLRPKRLYTVGSSGNMLLDSGDMLYDGSGNLRAQGTDVFVYDEVSRIVDASYSDGSFGQGYDYDRYGNITSVSGDTIGMIIPPVDPATNRLTGVTYDAAGNMKTAPPPNHPGNYIYDTGNRLVGQGTMRYLYDAFGERAVSLKNVPGVESVTFHLRDHQNRLVSQIHRYRQGKTDEWTRQRDYVFAGNRLVGRFAEESGNRHSHLDRLGSVELKSDDEGNSYDQNLFMPYGERFSDSTSDSLLFAGPHERDFSTDTDYMHARHYWWKLGRFNSPDPVLGSPDEPQSWNRYAYVMGNPMNFTDPTGLERTRGCDLHTEGAGECTTGHSPGQPEDRGFPREGTGDDGGGRGGGGGPGTPAPPRPADPFAPPAPPPPAPPAPPPDPSEDLEALAKWIAYITGGAITVVTAYTALVKVLADFSKTNADAWKLVGPYVRLVGPYVSVLFADVAAVGSATVGGLVLGTGIVTFGGTRYVMTRYGWDSNVSDWLSGDGSRPAPRSVPPDIPPLGRHF